MECGIVSLRLSLRVNCASYWREKRTHLSSYEESRKVKSKVKSELIEKELFRPEEAPEGNVKAGVARDYWMRP